MYGRPYDSWVVKEGAAIPGNGEMAYSSADGQSMSYNLPLDFASYNATTHASLTFNFAALNKMHFAFGNEAEPSYHGSNKGAFDLNFLTCEFEVVDLETVDGCPSSIEHDHDDHDHDEEEEEEDPDSARANAAAAVLTIMLGVATAAVLI